MVELTVKIDERDLIAEVVSNSNDADIVDFVSNLADTAFWMHDDIREQIIKRLQEDM